MRYSVQAHLNTHFMGPDGSRASTNSSGHVSNSQQCNDTQAVPDVNERESLLGFLVTSMAAPPKSHVPLATLVRCQ